MYQRFTERHRRQRTPLQDGFHSRRREWRAVWRSSGSCCKDLRDGTRICRGQATSICPSRYSYTYNSIHPLMPRDPPYASLRSCRPSSGKQLRQEGLTALIKQGGQPLPCGPGSSSALSPFICTSPAARFHLVTKFWPWRSEEVWGGPYPPPYPACSLTAKSASHDEQGDGRASSGGCCGNLGQPALPQLLSASFRVSASDLYSKGPTLLPHQLTET